MTNKTVYEMTADELMDLNMAEDAAEDAANQDFYAACDAAFGEGIEAVGCAPTLRSAELPARV